jgi:UDP-3-O-[3-hydroxymyristoyl] glucosamine N-acyltransferase
MGQKITSGDLVKQLGGELIGDSNILINSVASLESADQHSISFFNNLKYLELLKKTNAGVVILNRESLIYHSINAIVVDNPHLYFAKILSIPINDTSYFILIGYIFTAITLVFCFLFNKNL